MIKKIILAVFIFLNCVNISFAWDIDWDFDTPAGTDDAGQLDTFIQDVKEGFAERLDLDHYFPEDNTLSDNLTVGSHRQVTMYRKTSAPSVDNEYGKLYTIQDGTDEELGFSSDAGDIQITKDGNLNVSSLSDLTLSNSLSVGNDVTINDDLGIDGDVTIVSTLWVNGKYIAALSSYETTDVSQVGGSSVTLADDTEYQAAFDGKVYAYTTKSAENKNIIGWVNTASPATSGLAVQRNEQNPAPNAYLLISFDVAKGEYWQVQYATGTGSCTVYFKPKK